MLTALALLAGVLAFTADPAAAESCNNEVCTFDENSTSTP